MSSVSNGLYFLTLPLVRVMRVIYRKIRHARYLYIKRNVEKVWGARYILGARYLSKNTTANRFSALPYIFWFGENDSGVFATDSFIGYVQSTNPIFDLP